MYPGVPYYPMNGTTQSPVFLHKWSVF
jgi:hypothetical protein